MKHFKAGTLRGNVVPFIDAASTANSFIANGDAWAASAWAGLPSAEPAPAARPALPWLIGGGFV